MTADESLQLAIAFAIGKTSMRPRSRDASANDREKMDAARIIVDHLKLCGYTITPGTPPKPHSFP